MICIVPLAGPDFYTEKNGIKPLFSYKGAPLFASLLKKRSWFPKIKELIFVLCEKNPHNDQFVSVAQTHFPQAEFVFLKDYTKGSLLTCAEALVKVQDLKAAVVLDLIDIDFNETTPVNLDLLQSSLGIIPYFESNESIYSYLELNQKNEVLKTREKVVISTHASAGVYFYRNSAAFLRSVDYSLSVPSELTYKGLFFPCPSYNAFTVEGEKVMGVEVQLTQSVSKDFKV